MSEDLGLPALDGLKYLLRSVLRCVGLRHVRALLPIAFGVRLGYPASALGGYPRVCRNLEDFTHHNKFGNKDPDWANENKSGKTQNSIAVV
jgi:hypothetical protein